MTSSSIATAIPIAISTLNSQLSTLNSQLPCYRVSGRCTSTPVTTFSAAIAILLAAVIGFAIHRASLCNVRAVAEVLSTRRGFMLLSFFKTILWVISITWVIDLIAPSNATRPHQLWAFSPRALAGGFVIGIGAAINGGCALGTLGLLGNGQLRMLATLLGLVMGLAGGAHAQVNRWLPFPEGAESSISLQPVAGSVLGVVLALWALREILNLWQRRNPGVGWINLVLSNRYRLSTAAMLLGLANGVIYAFHGGWSYTRTARTAIDHVVAGGPQPGILYGALFFAVIAGVVFSSLSNGSFALDWRVRLSWLRNLAGGILMGIGVVLTPGGNDVLILHTIPSGSPHALPAYAALLAGTAIGLMVIRAVVGSVPKIECTGDVCRMWVPGETK